MLTYPTLKMESLLMILQQGGYIVDSGRVYGDESQAQKTKALATHEQMAILKRDHGLALFPRPRWLLDLKLTEGWGQLATGPVWMLPAEKRLPPADPLRTAAKAGA